ncbi:hypothetical protein AVEN_32651-1 [Araneus ventricosus]|uniref:Uncharacterized protein n=1 Tax=Araneus ventricosus TaxID=182803 RepID=A0A4Y2C813_ARAVE|nr:hypothetical protein AVEN_32651-1 [Araneus ventricosus]
MTHPAKQFTGTLNVTSGSVLPYTFSYTSPKRCRFSFPRVAKRIRTYCYPESNDYQKALKKIRDKSEQTEVVLIKMDIRNLNDIENARKSIEDKVGDKGLNLLINNAGVLKHQGFPEITEENLLFHFTTNTIGPVMVLKVNLIRNISRAIRNF